MSNTEFIDLSNVNINDTFEPTVKPAGEEAKLRIVGFLSDVNKHGNRYIMPFFEVTDDPQCKEFSHYIELPHDGMSPKEANNAKLAMQGLSGAFDIDFSSQLDIKNDVIGKTGWAILGIGKDVDKNPANTIRKYVTGA
ncbi:MAG: hypothetical protein KKF27_20565 [Gammaproteobacteria bacterium]|uniref:Uncharacterized protein n=1 Tax=viral metagenome TaxID=1070528 RepID=A0A6M3L080_9ZZZZ|nr:hypothetical protein [Gammaproteobacteria bacterium]